MAKLSENDLKDVQPLFETDQVSTDLRSLHDEINEEEWSDLYKKLSTNSEQEMGESSVQRRYVTDTVGTTTNLPPLSEEEGIDPEDELQDVDDAEDEETALKALNQMITEFGGDSEF